MPLPIQASSMRFGTWLESGDDTGQGTWVSNGGLRGFWDANYDPNDPSDKAEIYLDANNDGAYQSGIDPLIGYTLESHVDDTEDGVESGSWNRVPTTERGSFTGTETGFWQLIANTLVFDTTEVADNVIGTIGGDVIRGLGGEDILNGYLGDDTLIGGKGKDRLTGGVGADNFAFDAREKKQRANLADVITDFSAEEGDQLLVSRIAYKIKGKVEQGILTVGTEAEAQKARKSNDCFVYVSSTGSLYLNQNGKASGWGNGGGLIAELSGNLGISDANILIV